MNRLLGLVSAGVLFAVVTATSGRAQTPAVVSGDRLNVRSRPSLSGEVVTQLARGQVVTVLDESWRTPGATNVASEWVRIELPALTHVWVSAEFVDAAAGTVKPKRLNVRAGPGEEYGVLGTLSEGTAVRKVGENKGWLEIEAPTGLSAYVAAGYLQKVGAASPAAPGTEKPAAPLPAAPVPTPTNNLPPQTETTNTAAQPSPPQHTPTAPPPVPAETEAKPRAEATTPAVAAAPSAPAESAAAKPAPTAEKTVAEAAAQPSTEKPPGETTTPVATEPTAPKPITSAPATSMPASTNVTAAPPPETTAAKPSEPVVAETTVPGVTETVPAPAAPPPAEARPVAATTEATPPAEPEQPPAKRVVRREGTVRATLSFQAPTPFELRAPDTGATMDYLLPASTNIHIKTFWGARVIVTGQEAIDSRWPKTPVIKVEKIELAP